MKKVTLYISILFTFLTISLSSAQDNESVLKEEDIKLFLETFDPIEKNLNAIGDEYEDIEELSQVEAVLATEKVKSIFKNHGWGDDYVEKYMAIIYGAMKVTIDRELDALPAEQREFVRQTLEDTNSLNGFESISEHDYQLIEKHYSDIELKLN